MLHVTCPRPCCPAVFCRVGSHRQHPTKSKLLGSYAQRSQRITSALPSYQDVLKEGLVKKLSDLARSIRKRGVPARTVKFNYATQCLLSPGSIRCPVRLSANVWQTKSCQLSMKTRSEALVKHRKAVAKGKH